MFVRRKVNRSGTTSVVVIDKSGGKFRQVKCFGTSSDTSEIERLCGQAADWVMRYGGQQLIDFDAAEQARRDSTTGFGLWKGRSASERDSWK